MRQSRRYLRLLLRRQLDLPTAEATVRAPRWSRIFCLKPCTRKTLLQDASGAKKAASTAVIGATDLSEPPNVYQTIKAAALTNDWTSVSVLSTVVVRSTKAMIGSPTTMEAPSQSNCRSC